MVRLRKGATFVVLVLSMFAELVYGQSCGEVDRYALQYLIQELPLVGKEFSTWHGENCCIWDGVTCDSSGHVIYLNIINPDIRVPRPTGTDYVIGSGLGDLQSMINLTMMNIPFDGELPMSWGGLTNLKVLNIDGCNVAGNIPQELCLLTKLEIFIVKDNFLNGTVPTCFMNPKQTYANIKSFNMSGNLFTGTVPTPF